MFKVSPNLRVTLSAAASSPAKVIPLSTISFTLLSVSEILVFCPAFVAFNLSIASLIVVASSVVPSALVMLKVGPVTVPSVVILVPPITVDKPSTAFNLPFVASDKSKEYLRTLSVPSSPPEIVRPLPVTATVVSFAFTLYVVTPEVVVVSVVTVVLIPLATFTAS